VFTEKYYFLKCLHRPFLGGGGIFIGPLCRDWPNMSLFYMVLLAFSEKSKGGTIILSKTLSLFGNPCNKNMKKDVTEHHKNSFKGT
jgi:hypothetical protein